MFHHDNKLDSLVHVVELNWIDFIDSIVVGVAEDDDVYFVIDLLILFVSDNQSNVDDVACPTRSSQVQVIVCWMWKIKNEDWVDWRILVDHRCSIVGGRHKKVKT